MARNAKSQAEFQQKSRCSEFAYSVNGQNIDSDFINGFANLLITLLVARIL
jgi:hypothetical protein